MTVREFWHEHPRRLIMMLEEKKKTKRYDMQLLAYLINGGKLEEAEEKETGKRPGVDYPAGEGSTAWMYGS